MIEDHIAPVHLLRRENLALYNTLQALNIDVHYNAFQRELAYMGIGTRITRTEYVQLIYVPHMAEEFRRDWNELCDIADNDVYYMEVK